MVASSGSFFSLFVNKKITAVHTRITAGEALMEKGPSGTVVHT